MATRSGRRLSWLKPWKLPLLAGSLLAFSVVSIAAPAASATTRPVMAAASNGFTIVPSHVAGNLDCNGHSTIQKTIIPPLACTDIRGSAINTKFVEDGRFYDNGHYIGHDEPDMTFFDNAPGSGDSSDWSETLPMDPTLPPTATTPGKDVTDWFELSVAPWFGMALCDGNSYPQLPCTPNSDSNAPSCIGVACPPNTYPGGGSAFLEMQFYPPGDAPFVENISCDNTHWCAALHINEAICTLNFVNCNKACEETTNFAFVQRNGIPTGPPSPQLSTNASSTPNAETLLMNPGDKLQIHIGDAPAPGVPSSGIPPGNALRISIDDLTTHQSGFMQASAFNGFTQTDIQPVSGVNCTGRFFNFEPEYSTAKVGNIVPWAALQADVSTEFEIGHFTPCTSVSGSVGDGAGGAGDNVADVCNGPYEPSGDGGSGEDIPCWTNGDTHGTLNSPPNRIANCLDDGIGGDLDFDGSPYRADWPTGTTLTATSRTAQSFVQSMPTWDGQPYPEFMFQTDTGQSEATCDIGTGAGCVLPPTGSYVDQPGGKSFFPFWSLAQHGGTCSIEFGNVTSGVNDFGGDAQYGHAMSQTLGYPEFEGNIYDNTCPPQLSQGYLLSGQGGQVVSAGDAAAFAPVHAPAAPVVGIEATASGKGYFAVTSHGIVSTGGDAVFHGDLSTLPKPVDVSDIVAIAPTTDNKGYWLIGADGGEFAFGDAKYHGSLPGLGIHVTDIIGMVATPSGAGYLIVGADGGVFAFGATHFFGSLPGIGVRVSDIRGILPAAAGTGYILVGADGGAFSFGHGAPFHGSLPGEGIRVSDVVGIALTTDDGGYWMAGSNGTVYNFGDARNLKSTVSGADLPITGITNVLTDLAEVGP